MYFVQDLLYIVLCAHCSVPQGYKSVFKGSVLCALLREHCYNVPPRSWLTFSRAQCSGSAMISSNMLWVNMWHLFFFWWGRGVVQCMWFFSILTSFVPKCSGDLVGRSYNPLFFCLLNLSALICVLIMEKHRWREKGYVVCEGNIHGTVGK